MKPHKLMKSAEFSEMRHKQLCEKEGREFKPIRHSIDRSERVKKRRKEKIEQNIRRVMNPYLTCIQTYGIEAVLEDLESDYSPLCPMSHRGRTITSGYPMAEPDFEFVNTDDKEADPTNKLTWQLSMEEIQKRRAKAKLNQERGIIKDKDEELFLNQEILGECAEVSDSLEEREVRVGHMQMDIKKAGALLHACVDDGEFSLEALDQMVKHFKNKEYQKMAEIPWEHDKKKRMEQTIAKSQEPRTKMTEEEADKLLTKLNQSASDYISMILTDNKLEPHDGLLLDRTPPKIMSDEELECLTHPPKIMIINSRK